jgi:hypothetical protein
MQENVEEPEPSNGNDDIPPVIVDEYAKEKGLLKDEANLCFQFFMETSNFKDGSLVTVWFVTAGQITSIWQVSLVSALC